MFGIPFKRLSAKIRGDFKHNLKGNAVYKKHRWNLAERIQIYCSTHYIKALIFLWATAVISILAALYFRPESACIPGHHQKCLTEFSGKMTDLLGGQLTLIGIVFPLVVGLITVLFQKKSSRIHIQSAYQLYSGYMFAGLSGLSLAAFILIGELALTLKNNYLDTTFAVIAFIWMLFNIVLSMWFFITSLGVLDDRKRDRLMLKYFQSQIVENYLQRSLKDSDLQKIEKYLKAENINGIKILPFSVSDEEKTDLIKKPLQDGMEITDVYLWPLLFLLRRLYPLEGKNGTLIILPSLWKSDNTITLLASTDVVIPRWWIFFFRRCFIKGPQHNWKEYSHITRDFYGEAYDALEDRNISTFISATDRLVETYTTLRKSFRHTDGNYTDECGGTGLAVSFSQSFHYDFYSFSLATVKSLDITGEYFRKLIEVPFSIYRHSESKKIGDFQQCIQSLLYVWHALIDWKTGYGENMSVSQEQRHRECVKDFIGEWESWYMWRLINNRTEGRYDCDPAQLLYHLYQTAQIVMRAVMADDRYASDHSTDTLLLWYSRNRFEQHFEQYRWHSFFLTPAYLTLAPDQPEWLTVLRGNQYSEKVAQAIIFSNALADVRLLTAGYILSHIKQKKNVCLKDVVRRLLRSELVYPTGAHEPMKDLFTSATDIIDSIIRLEYRQDDREDDWYRTLSGLVETFSSFNKTAVIAGRIYLGTYEDVRNIYTSYADIAFFLSAKSQSVSQRVQVALNDNLFPYRRKEQIIYQLSGMKRGEDTPPDGYLMSEQAFKAKITGFNDTLEAYINAFRQSMRADLLSAEVDTERLKNADLTLTRELPAMLTQDALLSLFSFSSPESGDNKQWLTRSLPVRMPKKSIARGIASNGCGELMPPDAIKVFLLHDIFLCLVSLPPVRTEYVRDVEGLLEHLREMTADNEGYTLIFFGTRLQSELRDLTYHEDRHAELGITLDWTSSRGGLMPIRINNCGIYAVDGYEGCYSLLIRNNIFGNLHLHGDPDGLLFSSSWQASGEDPLSGTVTTTWEQEMEIKGSVVTRFEHL